MDFLRVHTIGTQNGRLRFWAARKCLILFGWEAGTRTPIARSRVWSPTIGRPPSKESEFTYQGCACQLIAPAQINAPSTQPTAQSLTPLTLNSPAAANAFASSGRYSQCHDSFDTVRTKPCFGP